jgi:hypothetical protein
LVNISQKTNAEEVQNYDYVIELEEEEEEYDNLFEIINNRCVD